MKKITFTLKPPRKSFKLIITLGFTGAFMVIRRSMLAKRTTTNFLENFFCALCMINDWVLHISLQFHSSSYDRLTNFDMCSMVFCGPVHRMSYDTVSTTQQWPGRLVIFCSAALKPELCLPLYIPLRAIRNSSICKAW